MFQKKGLDGGPKGRPFHYQSNTTRLDNSSLKKPDQPTDLERKGGGIVSTKKPILTNRGEKKWESAGGQKKNHFPVMKVY